jgi:dipeptidyl aminopeptidase/acylaminoacyl peptidase
MLALTEPSDGLEGGDDNIDYSSAVQAVVSFAGPMDMNFESRLSPDDTGAYMGATRQARPDAYKRASPITYARPAKAPILTIQGDQDLIFEEVVLFDKKMKEVGGVHTLIIKKGAGHMDFDTGDKLVWDILERYLK